MADSSWNIMQDLQFLIATDDELQGELVHVCDILDSDPSTDEPEQQPNEARRRKRRVRVDNYKLELTALRAQVNTLKAELDRMKAANPTMDMPAWKLAARRERIGVMRCQDENDELRAAVDEQESLLAHMKRLLNKKPRWTLSQLSSDEEWSNYKLAAHTSLRVAAIHAIADRQFRRQNGAFIAAGLVDVVDDVIEASLVTLPGHGAALQAVQVASFDASWRVVASAVWDTVTKDRGFTAPDNAVVVVEHIDSHTLYDRFHVPSSTPLSTDDGHHSNNIRKLFHDDHRVVLVWRTVLEDVLVPHMSKGAVDNSWGWIEATPHPLDPTKCQLKCMLQIPLGPVLETTRRLLAVCGGALMHTEDAVVEMVRRSHFGQPDNAKFDMATVPYPIIRTILERGKAFELALCATVEAHAAAHQTPGARSENV